MTKKLLNIYSLYHYIFFCFIFSAALSLGIWNVTSNLTDKIMSQEKNRITTEEKAYLDTATNTLSYMIETMELTSKDMTRHPVSKILKDYDYFIIDADGEMMGDDGRIHDDLDEFIENGLLIYPLKFKDGTGFILVKPDMSGIGTRIYRTGVAVVSLGFFFLLTLYLISKPLRYIRQINDGIDVLAGGSLSYRIPERGHNELTHLALSINEMSSSLKRTLEEEKKAEIKQRRLITNLSHDLRTPLTAIIGYLNILTDKKYTTDEEREEYIQQAMAKSYRLEKLVNDLFAYTRLTNGDMPYHLTLIDPLLFVQQFLDTQPIPVTLNSPERVSAVNVDVEWLQRIFDNLFSNISKYATSNKPVTLTLEDTEESLIISLENETMENLEGKVDALFDRMYTAQEDRSNPSSGLGLSIIREYMKQMGGHAYAEFKAPYLKIILSFPIKDE